MRIRRQPWWEMMWLVLVLAGCSRDSGSSTKGQPEGEKLAAASLTPAFRNLGKRGESIL